MGTLRIPPSFSFINGDGAHLSTNFPHAWGQDASVEAAVLRLVERVPPNDLWLAVVRNAETADVPYFFRVRAHLCLKGRGRGGCLKFMVFDYLTMEMVGIVVRALPLPALEGVPF